MNFYFLAGLHGDGEGCALEAGYEVEGALFWDGFEARGGVGTDDEGAVWFLDADGFGVGLGDCFGGSGDDGKDELEWGLRGGIDACDDFDGGLGKIVGEVIVGFASGWRLMGGGEEAAFCNEGDFPGGAHLFVERDKGGFEVA